jgi:hypothetical protein
MGGSKGTYRASVGRFDGKRQLKIPKRRWEDKVETDLQEMGWGHGLD